jgi:nitroreductase
MERAMDVIAAIHGRRSVRSYQPTQVARELIEAVILDAAQAPPPFRGMSAHARGLGTCWVGSPMLWITTPEVRAELKIPPQLTPVAVFCLGYAAATPEPVVHERPPVVWS